ncbi:class I SAM-dependent methyltransferase [Methylobacterium variabile]|jgi:hypothetical protein|uniref:class I SAM-dependent methyltransferase n=1 Tax=Methylobacterium variabile TaxID=298794 RepID=UPI000A5431C7|nr:class I SAM-dependent methyltransferase [Methylobacterium variabile]
MERYQVLQGLLALFEAPAYLEVGVDKGETFHGLRAGSKIAVDPTFSFDVDAARQQADNQNCRYFNVTSDQFFQTEAPVHRFDVIYIDGLHTFEQTLRDFLNATVALKPGGVVVIDDVIPASYAASLPDLDLSRRFWQATSNPDGSWMGDVYKLVFFIHHFMPSYSYATIVENHGQTVVWQAPRALPGPVFKDVEAIARATYVDVVMNMPLFNLSHYSDIVSRLRER